MRQIKTTKGRVAIVDDEDYELASLFKWHYSGRYVVHTFRNEGKRYVIRLHRLIAKTPDSMLTDHINGDTLDNRKHNLRICNKSQNVRNRKIQKNKSSRYKGVSWSKESKKWRAQIKLNYKIVEAGFFDNEIGAAKAYNEWATMHHKEFARLNDICSKNRPTTK